MSPTSSRDAILQRIRAGLDKGALPMPYPDDAVTPLSTPFADTSQDGLELQFAQAFSALGGKFILCSSHAELIQNLDLLIDQTNWKDVLCAEPEWLRMFQESKLDYIRAAHPRHESADACITGCEALVARTGSVLLSSRQTLGRIGPVYWPAHIIIAYAWQLVGDVGDALTTLLDSTDGKLPSMINLNTGPSRTADIEKTLVVGVHGPKEVYCFFVNH